MASLLTSVLDNSAKISDYIDACKKNGINILPPNVNVSNKTFTVGEDNKTVMFGLLAIKNLGHDFIDTIINERRLNGKFTSFYSFCKRVHGKGFNRRAVEGLIKSGALDGLGSNRQEMLMNLPDVIDDLDSSRRRNIEGQIGFFDLISNDSSSSEFVMKKMDEFPSHTMLMMEKETTGLYISSHPMEQYKELANKLKCDTIGDILNADNDFNSKYVDSFSVKIMGIINGITRKQTKAGDTMAFVTVEGVTGSVEVVIFPKLFTKYSNLLYNSNVILVGGRLSMKEEENPKIILDFADSAESVKSNQTKRKGLFIRVENESSPIYFNCNQLITSANQGDTPVYFYFANSKKYFPCKKITMNDNLLYNLRDIAGEQNVILQL
jgi:DNA polymerase-3 subunit alpha